MIQGCLSGLISGHGRSRRRDVDRPEVIERPKRDGVIHARPWAFDLTRLHDATGDAHVIDRPIATKGTFDQAADGDLIRHRARSGDRRLTGEHLATVDPQRHGFIAETDEQVMPFSVRDFDLTLILAAATRKIDAEASAAGITVDLPMPRAGLRSAGREDVEALLAIQLAPQLDRERPAEAVLRRRMHLPAAQSLAELGRQGRHSSRHRGLNRHHRRRLNGISPILRLRAGRQVIQLRHEVTKSVEVIQESPFGILHGVIENADRPRISAGPDLTQHLEVLGAGSDGQYLTALGVASDVHAVEVQAEQMRQHEL